MRTTSAEIDRFYRQCKENNLKITPQRTALFEDMIDYRDHPTAETVYKRVREKLPNISYDTVNRTLLSFAEMGIIKQIETRGSAKRFDADIEQHHHFQCIRCGRITDFEDEGYNRLKMPETLPEGFIVLDKRVFLEGICSNCRS